MHYARWLMLALIAAVTAFLFVAPLANAAPQAPRELDKLERDAPIAWCEPGDEARANCPNQDPCKTGKPVMYYFMDDTCPACRMMSERILSDPRVRKRLSGYIMMKVDLLKYPEMAKQAGVKVRPTIDLWPPGCARPYRIMGTPPRVEQFLEKLDEAERLAPAPPKPKPLPPGIKET